MSALVARPGIEQRLVEIISKWEDVEVLPHSFGGIEFRFDNREIGHLHGSAQADLPFPIRIRRELVASGRALAHALLPDTGWVSFRIRSERDVNAVIELFRLNYERLRNVWGPGSKPR